MMTIITVLVIVCILLLAVCAMLCKCGLPHVYTPDDLQDYSVTTYIEGRGWVCARPYPRYELRLFTRIKRAFLVFVGVYDVLRWELENK
jgi:hypothetical protein